MSVDAVHHSKSGAKSFLFLSSCPEAWGGSEELWCATALRLATAGHRVHVIKSLVDFEHPRILELISKGVVVEDYWNLPVPRLAKWPRRLLLPSVRERLNNFAYNYLYDVIGKFKPDMTVISQGENFDGLHFIGACLHRMVPYAIICQKASDIHWPADETRPFMRRCYFDAKACYFVSQHNRNLTETQIGGRLLNAEVVRNPFLTPVDEPLPWPDAQSGELRLACVARMFVAEKGQDILLEVLSSDKWKQRPVSVNFFGKGIHTEALQQMAGLLGVRNAHFPGFSRSVVDIWANHHALVLPSRAEGLPLSLVEAMLCGRPAIVAPAGGVHEVLDDNETGFIAAGPSPQAFDEALERAWQRRDEWQAIGRLAAERVRGFVPEEPGDVMTSKILRLAA